MLLFLDWTLSLSSYCIVENDTKSWKKGIVLGKVGGEKNYETLSQGGFKMGTQLVQCSKRSPPRFYKTNLLISYKAVVDIFFFVRSVQNT
jgi:hypothetical protein